MGMNGLRKTGCDNVRERGILPMGSQLCHDNPGKVVAHQECSGHARGQSKPAQQITARHLQTLKALLGSKFIACFFRATGHTRVSLPIETIRLFFV